MFVLPRLTTKPLSNLGTEFQSEGIVSHQERFLDTHICDELPGPGSCGIVSVSFILTAQSVVLLFFREEPDVVTGEVGVGAGEPSTGRG